MDDGVDGFKKIVFGDFGKKSDFPELTPKMGIGASPIQRTALKMFRHHPGQERRKGQAVHAWVGGCKKQAEGNPFLFCRRRYLWTSAIIRVRRPSEWPGDRFLRQVRCVSRYFMTSYELISDLHLPSRILMNSRLKCKFFVLTHSNGFYYKQLNGMG